MKRRLLTVAIAFAWLAGCNSGPTGTSAIPPSGSGLASGNANSRMNPDNDVNEMPVPPEVDAVNGVAKVDLLADINPATGFPAFDYDGVRNVIPTIRVSGGDTIVVNVQNNIMPTKGMTDDVNLHFHGLVVSPNAPGDDVLDTLATPGEKLHYIVHVPKWQEPGIYWYHPHVHGVVNYQVGEGGMSGAIIVDGLQQHIPALRKMRERLIIVRSTGIGNTAQPNPGGAMADMNSDDCDPTMTGQGSPDGSNKAPCGPDTGLTTTLNGAFHPDITMKPGEQQLFRVVNATGHKTLKLAVDGESLQLVAVDGYALDSYPGTPTSITLPDIVVPAAARADFVVTAPQSGTVKFRTKCYYTGPNGDPDPALVLGHIVVKGKSNGFHKPAELIAGAPLPQNYASQALPAPVITRRVVFSESPVPRFFINGKAFKPNAPVMYTVKTGTIEKWHIINVTKEIHDFHIHQIHFLVIEVNGRKIAHPYWSDSYIIPHRRQAGKNGSPGWIVALMDFRDKNIKGTFVFHCHIVDHEDAGMMAKIQAI